MNGYLKLEADEFTPLRERFLQDRWHRAPDCLRFILLRNWG